MTTIKERYKELLSLTQLFLLREYHLKEVKPVDPAIFAFLRKKMATPESVQESPQPLSKPIQPAQFAQIPTRATTVPPSPDPHPPKTRPEPMPPVKPEPIPPQPLPPPSQPEPPSPNPQLPAIQDKLGKTNLDSKKFTLEPLAAPTASSDQSEFWKLFPNLFPDMVLCGSIPNDSVAQKLKNVWLDNQVIPPVIILSFHDEERQLTFLKNLARAISLRLAPARVLSASKLEKEKGWENVLKSSSLRLVIASDYGLYLQPGLMHFYREVPQQGKHFLNHLPLLLLSDLSLYLKDPQLKSLLWRAICNEFAASQHNPSIR